MERKRQRRGYLQTNRKKTSSCALKQSSSLSLGSQNAFEASQDTSFREEDWWVDSSQSDEGCCTATTQQTHLPSSDTPIIFCNRGLEKWTSSREAWRKSHFVSDGTATNTAVRSQPLKRRDREHVKEMLRTRMGPHPLPQLVALPEMIEIYNFIWNEDDSDA